MNVIYKIVLIFILLFKGCEKKVSSGAPTLPLEYEILWESAGDITTRVYCLQSTGGVLFAGTYNGLYFSSDSGQTWNVINTGLNISTIRALAVKDELIFAAGGILEGGVSVSSDNGMTWKDANNGLPNTSVSSLAVNNKYLFAGTFGYGIFISDDNGSKWRRINSGLPATIGDVTALAVDGDRIMALINSDTSGFFISENFGVSWKNMSEGLPPVHTDFTSLAVHDNFFFLSADGDSGGVFVMPKGGNSWSRLSLPDRSVSIVALKGSVIFAGGFGGMSASTNGGADWVPADNGLYPQGLPDVNAILWLQNDLWAGLNFGGVYRLPLPQSLSYR
jgi:ligand-binding sensor domain-containing protein